MSISKRIRFEVFKRDKFTCQYCGKAAPDVVLEVDHIDPKSKGGKDDILNYVTSCYDCNHGKSNITLADDTAIKKRKAQLDLLQERREQLEMLMEWHKSLIDLDKYVIDEINNIWSDLVPGFVINDVGISQVKSWVRRFGVNEVLEALKTSVEQYLVIDNLGKIDNDSANKAFDYIPRICNAKKMGGSKPYLKDLYYIRGILANRFSWIDKKNWKVIKMMEEAHLAGMPTEDIKSSAINSNNWTEFKSHLLLFVTDSEIKEDLQ